MSTDFNVLVFQPALPAYRLDYFNKIAIEFSDRFRVYYSGGDLGVLTESQEIYSWATPVGKIKKFFGIAEWQEGVLSVPISKGDVVVIPGGPRCITNLLLLFRARIFGAKTIWWGHYWSSTSKKHRMWFRMLLMKVSHSVLFYTDLEVEEYRKGFGRNDLRVITALNNGINVAPIRPYRVPYNAYSRENSALFIGRLTKKANLDLAFKALADERTQGLVLHILGDGAEKERLKLLALELGVAERVRWHPATVDEKRISEIANRCRFFIYTGSVGLSLIHAMAYGLPAIVHDQRFLHMPEIAAFEDGVTGIAFRNADSASLASAIESLSHDFLTLNAMSEASIERVEKSFNTYEMSRRFCDLVRNL